MSVFCAPCIGVNLVDRGLINFTVPFFLPFLRPFFFFSFIFFLFLCAGYVVLVTRVL